MTDISECNFIMKWHHFLLDFSITLVLWFYYTLGFVLFFAPFYLLAYCFAKKRRTAFQKLNHIFYKGFFGLIKLLIPACRWQIPKADPILLISIYARHTTIAKARLFGIPVLGTILSLSGYIPSTARGRFADLMVDRIDGMACFRR